MRRYFVALLSFASFVVAVIPLLLVFAPGVSFPFSVLLILNYLGWSAACLLYVSEYNLLNAIDQTGQRMGFSMISGTLGKKVKRFLSDLECFATASLDLMSATGGSRTGLWQNLSKIANTVYSELNAQAVELALFDEKTGLWIQAMLIGQPNHTDCQAMLSEIDLQAVSKEVEHDGSFTLTHPVAFSGTLFGTLRVEMRPGTVPTSQDRRLLELFATHGALMLVDAQFTQEIIRMRKAGEESVRAKTGFLANLSHEIRGPLGIILNGVELMDDGLCGPITETQRETLGMIKQNGDHLLDLVNDVLDYAKVEAGKIKARPVSLVLSGLLTDLSNVVRSQTISKKQKLIVEKVDDDLAVQCDKRHIRQMLINLLTNAVKYTPEKGSITVSAERVVGGRVRITVQDTGIGIPISEREKVFGAFERVDDKYAQSQVGTGLGMPLTKKLVEVNKGTIDFESEEGVGSTFWVILPAGTIPKEEENENSEDLEHVKAQGKGELILLIDEATVEREMLEKYLTHQGFDIVTATTGAQVVKVLKDKKIEIAVVECDLPEISGEAMIGIIRQFPTAFDLPIIMLSSKAFVFDIERYLKLGVDRCLSKPVNLNEVAQTTRHLIDEMKDFYS